MAKFSVVLLLVYLLAPRLLAQKPALGLEDLGHERWLRGLVGQTPDSARIVRFETTEGTAMNVDVSPDGKTIVFDLLGDLYTLPIAGGTATRLTSGSAFDAEPRFSPDGRRIAFISDRSGSDNIWLIDADGRNTRAFTHETTDPVAGHAWIAGGDVELVARKGNEYWLYRADGTGTALRPRLASNISIGEEAAWSPDGRFLYTADGEGIRRIDLARGIAEVVGERWPPAFQLTVSPDGQWLAFVSQQEQQAGLRLLNVTTAEQHWVVRSLTPGQGQTLRDRHPSEVRRFAFLPDGKAVVLAAGGTLQRLDLRSGKLQPIHFRAMVEQELNPRAAVARTVKGLPDSIRAIRDAQRDAAGTHTIFTALGTIWVRAGSAPAKPLVEQSGTTPTLQREPTLSPDGRTVAYVTWNDLDGGHVWRVPVRGGKPERLTNRRGVYRHPVWSPDGAFLAVIREEEQMSRNGVPTIPGEVYVLPATGGKARHIAASSADDRVTFTADGQAVVVLARPGASAETTPTLLAVSLKTGVRDTVAKLPAAVEQVVVSPDGRSVAYTIGSAVYVAEIVRAGGILVGAVTVMEQGGRWPARRVAEDGGRDLRWEADSRTLTWVRAGALVRLDVTRPPALAAAAASASGGSAPEPAAGRAAELIPIALAAPRSTPTGSVALEGATVITMRGDEVLRDATVIVTGDRIAAVGPRGTVSVPAGAHRVDVRGKTIIPGLINVWGEVPLARDLLEGTNVTLAMNLAFGVTTVRAFPTGPGTMAAAARYAERLETGAMTGARFLAGGTVTAADAATLVDLDAARTFVQRQQESGAFAIAIAQDAPLTRRQRQWLAAAAREAGLSLVGAAADLRSVLMMAADGYHTIHGAIPATRLYDDVQRLLVASGAAYVPTLVAPVAGFRGFGTAEDYFLAAKDTVRDPKLQRLLGLDTSMPDWWRTPEYYRFVPVSRQAARLQALGTPVAAGTSGLRPGLGVHWEMWALEMGGFSAHEALRTATATAAAVLGVDHELGTIEAGKIADLVVLDADPLADLEHSRAARYVMRSGELFDATTLARIWPRAAPPLPLHDPRYAPPPVTAEAAADQPASEQAVRGTAQPGAVTARQVGAHTTGDRLPIDPARTISFATTQGTAMNLDLSPDGRTLVFDLLGDIYTLPVEGGTAVQLTRGLGVDRRPVWSPDGKQIAFLSDGTGEENAWVMAADGSDPRPVAARGMFDPAGVLMTLHLEWTPDGRSLLSRNTLYHLAGGKRVFGELPSNADLSFGPPSRFSADGRYLYFTKDGVRRYDRVTGETIQLAQPPVYWGAAEPVVSPDGRWLAYIARPRDGELHSGLRVRDLETGEDRWLLYSIGDRRFGRHDRYVFTHDSKAIILSARGRLHRVDVTTGADRVIPFTANVNVDLGPFIYHEQRLTNDSLPIRYIRSPAFSPDGKTLAFTALKQLYTMALPNGTPRPLAEQEFGQFQPAYSPDGKWIAYVTWDDVEGGHVWRIPAAGGTPKRLTSVAAYYLRPVWSPDGTTIAVLKAGTKDATPTNAQAGWVQLLPSTGGATRTIVANASTESPVAFSPDGRRILFQDRHSRASEAAVLSSVRLDGSDRRVRAHVQDVGFIPGPTVPSPDGRYVAYMLDHELYLAPLAGPRDSVTLGISTEAVPVARLTHGALDPRWVQGGRRLTWVVANRVFQLDPDRAIAAAADTTSRITPDEVITIRLTEPRHVAHGVLALRGARVITMKGDEVLEDATIVIRNDRIAAVGPSSSVVIPKGAKVVDVRGRTIMPGLIDMHAHMGWRTDEIVTESDWWYVANLAYGVTTTRDPSAPTVQFGEVELIETGRKLGPRLISTGWSIDNARIDDLDDARAVVAHRRAMGTGVIKNRDISDRGWRHLGFLAAQEAGVNITTEGTRLDLILDGATGSEHGYSGALYGDVTRLVAEAKTWYTPTLGIGAKAYFRERYRSLRQDAKYRRLVPPEQREDLAQGEWQRPSLGLSWFDQARGAAEIARQGGHVTIGSHGDDNGLAVHWDLWALHMGGLTNHQALQSATLRGAEGLGMQRDLGSIEPGKLADLIVLEKNPLENIEHTLTVDLVMKNGVLYDGDTMTTVWPVERSR